MKMAGNLAHSLIGNRFRTRDVASSEKATFETLMLSPAVSKGLQESGFRTPSPIQIKAIPLGRCGLDLIVQAKSGTGKTCVFSVIALESLHVDVHSTQVLVLAPTREIAMQIRDCVRTIGKHVAGLECHSYIGGTPLHEDRLTAKKCHIAVGTPGRITQLIKEEVMHTHSIRVFVLDEADKLLETGFQDQINWIYAALPENKQILALSATYPESLANHVTTYMRDPTFIRLNSSDPALLGIGQFYTTVPNSPLPNIVFDSKVAILIKILSSVTFKQCLIFSNYQTRAQTLSEALNSRGWPTAVIAGCLDQQERTKAMQTLKSFQCRILVSTDLTSRGIDAEQVNIVINLDTPYDGETYLHRIGRAGRYGTCGIAINLVSEGKEKIKLTEIEQHCRTHISPLPDPLPVDLVESHETQLCTDADVTVSKTQPTPDKTTFPALIGNTDNCNTDICYRVKSEDSAPLSGICVGNTKTDVSYIDDLDRVKGDAANSSSVNNAKSDLSYIDNSDSSKTVPTFSNSVNNALIPISIGVQDNASIQIQSSNTNSSDTSCMSKSNISDSQNCISGSPNCSIDNHDNANAVTQFTDIDDDTTDFFPSAFNLYENYTNSPFCVGNSDYAKTDWLSLTLNANTELLNADNGLNSKEQRASKYLQSSHKASNVYNLDTQPDFQGSTENNKLSDIEVPGRTAEKTENGNGYPTNSQNGSKYTKYVIKSPWDKKIKTHLSEYQMNYNENTGVGGLLRGAHSFLGDNSSFDRNKNAVNSEKNGHQYSIEKIRNDVIYGGINGAIRSHSEVNSLINDEADVVNGSLITDDNINIDDIDKDTTGDVVGESNPITSEDCTGIKVNNIGKESCYKATEQRNEHIEKYCESTEKHDEPTEKHNENTEKHNANTEKHNESAEKHNENTEKHNENTEKHNENTEKHNENTEKHNENTEKHNEHAGECTNECLNTVLTPMSNMVITAPWDGIIRKFRSTYDENIHEIKELEMVGILDFIHREHIAMIQKNSLENPIISRIIESGKNNREFQQLFTDIELQQIEINRNVFEDDIHRNDSTGLDGRGILENVNLGETSRLANEHLGELANSDIDNSDLITKLAKLSGNNFRSFEDELIVKKNENAPMCTVKAVGDENINSNDDTIDEEDTDSEEFFTMSDLEKSASTPYSRLNDDRDRNMNALPVKDVDYADLLSEYKKLQDQQKFYSCDLEDFDNACKVKDTDTETESDNEYHILENEGAVEDSDVKHLCEYDYDYEHLDQDNQYMNDEIYEHCFDSEGKYTHHDKLRAHNQENTDYNKFGDNIQGDTDHIEFVTDFNNCNKTTKKEAKKQNSSTPSSESSYPIYPYYHNMFNYPISNYTQQYEQYYLSYLAQYQQQSYQRHYREYYRRYMKMCRQYADAYHQQAQYIHQMLSKY